jgi:hypothetical protein
VVLTGRLEMAVGRDKPGGGVFDRSVAERFIGQHLDEIESYQRALREHQARLRQLGLFNDPEAQ